VPPKQKEPAPAPSSSDLWSEAKRLEEAGQLEEAEAAIKKAAPHIGCAASIAEMYARRMRAFQRAGDEPQAIEAFKKAVDWMGTYAGWATSGGEGAALSLERDDFQAALAREFGYDPTEPPK
jgi:tetratricopeptide (TPR) repeat protein